MHNLVNTLKSFTDFTDKEIRHILHHFHPVTLKKGDDVMKEGDVCNSIWFVISGCIILVTNEKQRGKIIELFSKDYFFTELVSFANDTPTNFCLEAVTDTELLCISKSDYKALDFYCKNWRIFKLCLFERVGHYMVSEIMNLKINTNEERYNKLLEK